MFIKEVELFKDLGPGFMNEIAEVAQEVFLPADHLLFNRGSPAESLYILEEGRVNLFIQEGGSINFMLDKRGEVFGWSALVEPNLYTASARCYQDSKLIKIDRTSLKHIFEKYPREAYLVMKRLAGVVGQRLENSYRELLRSHAQAEAPSYG